LYDESRSPIIDCKDNAIAYVREWFIQRYAGVSEKYGLMIRLLDKISSITLMFGAVDVAGLC